MVNSQGSAKRTRIPPGMEPLGPSVEHKDAGRMKESNQLHQVRSTRLEGGYPRRALEATHPMIQHVLPVAVAEANSL